MYFIVSTGRSGTKTISKSLSLIDGCISYHEPYPQLIIESSAYRYGAIDEEALCDILRQTRTRTIDNKIYCESNQTLSLIIPILVKTFPTAKYIWLLRNGLDVVASGYQKQWYSGHSENNQIYENCPPIEKAWIDGRIQGNKCGEISDDSWYNMNRFERVCWYWSYINKTIETDLNKYASGKFLLIKLEKVNLQFSKTLKWMGLNPFITPVIKKHNKAKNNVHQWTSWNIEERRNFSFWCGDLMDKYYPEWRCNKNSWHGVQYYMPNGIMGYIRSRHGFIKRINSFFSK
jgi:hypothetical protein